VEPKALYPPRLLRSNWQASDRFALQTAPKFIVVAAHPPMLSPGSIPVFLRARPSGRPSCSHRKKVSGSANVFFIDVGRLGHDDAPTLQWLNVSWLTMSQYPTTATGGLVISHTARCPTERLWHAT
jgi:hypothetical protein